MADLLRIIFMILLVGAGLWGLVVVPMSAIGFANMTGGSAGSYVFGFVMSLPALAGSIGLILWARKLYKDW